MWLITWGTRKWAALTVGLQLAAPTPLQGEHLTHAWLENRTDVYEAPGNPNTTFWSAAAFSSLHYNHGRRDRQQVGAVQGVPEARISSCWKEGAFYCVQTPRKLLKAETEQIENIYRDRLGQFTSGGQYESKGLKAYVVTLRYL